jgi:formylglycine-generating enzyme required for sulfatase activity
MGFCSTESMVLIPSGSFWMGSPTDEPDRESDETLHFVQLTRSFYMGKYEVTQKEFKDVMGYNPSYFSSCGDNCPVEKAKGMEAINYVNELSKLEGFEQCFDCSGSGTSVTCSLKAKFATPYECKGYRLPTESEWEYAARAGTSTPFYNGDYTTENIDAIGWYNGNSDDKTHSVGQKLPNSLGLYDMSGNVWEWTMDRETTYPSGTEESPVIDPWSMNGDLKDYTPRGGGWYTAAKYCRHAKRNGWAYGNTVVIGFRVVRTK